MKNFTSTFLAIVTLALTATAANADVSNLGHAVSTVTDYGDGIKVSDFQDKSGFVAEGGGGQFTYDQATQTMTCVTPEGVVSYNFASLK